MRMGRCRERHRTRADKHVYLAKVRVINVACDPRGFNAVAWCVTRVQGGGGWSAAAGRARRLKELARSLDVSAAAHTAT
jgi:hypothetical protein